MRPIRGFPRPTAPARGPVVAGGLLLLVVFSLLVASSPVVSAPLGTAALPMGQHAGLAPPGAPTPLVPLPGPRLGHPALRPGSFVIDPNQSYTAEPAPMGVTDFGVTPSGAGYAYASPLIQASADIRSFSVSTGSAGPNMTFQLNVEDVVASGPSTFVFWIQDVAFFDTHSQVIYWEDNVWNLSGGTGAIYASSVAGNGSVIGSTYYADVANGYAGSGVALSEPTTITARVVATNASGSPHVAFEYQDGSGWVTFDNVTFPFTSVGVDQGFLVDGFQYTPLGGYYDAEWTLSGPGGGLSQRAVTADLNLTLSEWNGHNLQAVRSAYNHGGNTAESMSNIVDSFSPNGTTGALYGHSVIGSGTLAGLYGPGNTATLRVSTGNVSTGTIGVSGIAVPFVGGLANLTLAPGTFALQLLVNGSVVGATNVTMSAGEYRSILLAPFQYYPLEFVSVGLPPGSPWSVTVNGVPLAGSSAMLSTALRTGTYSYAVSGVAGYYLATYNGSINVSAGLNVRTFSWQATVYVSDFVAENRPPGVVWTVSVDGQNVSGPTDILVVSLPNGTYGFTASANRTVTITPTTGDVQVVSTGAVQYVFFAISPGELQGSVAPGAARLTVGGAVTNLSDGTYVVSLPPGTYSVVASLAGYQTFETNVSIAAGAASTLNINLTALPAPPATNGGGGLGDLGGTTWAILGGLVVVALAGLVVLLRRRPGPRR
ncbi:MAG TPA: thermopsin family protease [Thermoplasmata archaeon]|nr:thermopsin family protease [Thermoplasmata archaeon]